MAKPHAVRQHHRLRWPSLRRSAITPGAMDLTYSFDRERLDFETIHAWLTATYWSPGISRERVEQGFAATTLVIGCYLPDGRQIGVARCLTDTTRFAYFADVFVDDEFRGQGIAREMVRRILDHSLLAGCENQYLFTQDAHGVYAKLGFATYGPSERLMHRSQTVSAISGAFPEIKHSSKP